MLGQVGHYRSLDHCRSLELSHLQVLLVETRKNQCFHLQVLPVETHMSHHLRLYLGDLLQVPRLLG